MPLFQVGIHNVRKASNRDSTLDFVGLPILSFDLGDNRKDEMDAIHIHHIILMAFIIFSQV